MSCYEHACVPPGAACRKHAKVVCSLRIQFGQHAFSFTIGANAYHKARCARYNGLRAAMRNFGIARALAPLAPNFTFLEKRL